MDFEISFTDDFVSAIDGPTYFLVVALLGAAALIASLIPARRATKVNPTEALRAE